MIHGESGKDRHLHSIQAQIPHVINARSQSVMVNDGNSNKARNEVLIRGGHKTVTRPKLYNRTVETVTADVLVESEPAQLKHNGSQWVQMVGLGSQDCTHWYPKTD